MWRSLFIGIGIMAVIFGVECLLIESATLYSGESSSGSFFSSSASLGSTREWRPKEWMPWAVISSGVIIVLYAFTLPQRWNSAAG